jgi:orotate phosphoribosyltransferase/AMMECR1 domain-containing protein
MSCAVSDRDELLQLILKDGILHRSPTQPVLSRDGSSARWMLDSLSVTMQPRGAVLAGRCLLALLERFDGRQIATYGTTGIPLMQSVILQSGDRYHGLIVRKEKKAHGSVKRIEGRIDRDEPIVLLDDSVSSGLSMREGTAYLEDAGLRVEGGLVLVRFGWDAGFARMRERGYHMEAVFDVFQDLMENMEGEPKVDRNPTRYIDEVPWDDQQAPDGLHPAHLARLGMDAYLRCGKLPRAPQRLDSDYDSRGGAWVSLRDRDEIYLRHARDGFWIFPGEASPPTPESILIAALKTAKALGAVDKALCVLERSHIAVTFFGPLEECHLGQLDNDRYGIVVCSRERPSQMGGALPRMPGIGNEWEQFRHAQEKNAGLYSFEPYRLYRHDLQKAVEPGICWQPSGVPVSQRLEWHAQRVIGGAIAQRARDIARAVLLGCPETQPPLPRDLLPAGLHSLYVSVYLDGRLSGCAGSAIDHPERDLRLLVEAALNDQRFRRNDVPERGLPERIAATVSLLFNRLELGEMPPDEVEPRFRLGKQALEAEQGPRRGMLLPFVAVRNSLSSAGYVAEVIDKAGITRAPYRWIRYDCATWLADWYGVELLEDGFRQADSEYRFEDELRRLAEWQVPYLVRNILPGGTTYSCYEPFQNWIYRGDNAPRNAHLAWILMKAARLLSQREAFESGGAMLDFLLAKVHETPAGLWLELEGNPPSVSELSFVLLSLTELSPGDERRTRAPAIAAILWSRIGPHGRIATHREEEAGPDEYQDYFPGQTMLALAAAVLAGLSVCDETKIRRAFVYYRHRYRYKRNFGQVSWLMQAGRLWSKVTRQPDWTEFVFEIADWIREFQLERTGGFINRHQQDGPGYTTALYLEGLAAAADLARDLGDNARYRACIGACENGFRFLRQLVIRPDHDAMLPSPSYALGGVRRSLTASEVRLDFVQHSLAAVLELHSHLGMFKEPTAARANGSYSIALLPALQPGD